MNNLVKQYQETKNQDIFEKIYKQNKGLVCRVCSKYKENSLYTYEDIHQLGMISLLKAVETYDENKNTKFSTYAYQLINRDLAVELCINQNRKKRKADIISLDTKKEGKDGNGELIIEIIEDTNVNIEDEVINKIMDDVLKEFIQKYMNNYKREYAKKFMSVELTLQGLTNRECAELLPYCKSLVSMNWTHFSNYMRKKAIKEEIINN